MDVVVVFPTKIVAERCVSFLELNDQTSSDDTEQIRIEPLRVCQATMVIAPKACFQAIRLYWQHTGEILSSRYAKYVLERLKSGSNKTSTDDNSAEDVRETHDHVALRERIGEITHTQSFNVFLYPSGMAAIFACVRMLHQLRPDKKFVMFGFPYLDTLKLLKRKEFSAGVYFFPTGSRDELHQLQTILETEQISGIFTEFPGNPLPRSTDIKRLSSMAHENGTILVVDDTIGSFNIDVMKANAADVSVTSLTKIFSGAGNVMGGTVVLNPHSPSYETLSTSLHRKNDEFLFSQDVRVLLNASMDLPQRLARVNASAYTIVERLRTHPRVKAVYYPGHVDVQRYESYLRKKTSENLPQYGPVFSLLLHGGEEEAETFYDALKFSKGPSLGTNFTLCCPYTMLAHYDELDFVESCGIDRHLIRISVGLEPAEQIWQCFLDAFDNIL